MSLDTCSECTELITRLLQSRATVCYSLSISHAPAANKALGQIVNLMS